MLNVYFFKIRFFYLRKIEKNFDIRLKKRHSLRDVIGGKQRSKNPVWFELPQCWTAHRLTVVKTKYEL